MLTDAVEVMKQELRNLYLARLIIWESVIAFFGVLNISALTESWTNWNLLSIASQIVLFLCMYKSIRHSEVVLSRGIEWLNSRFTNMRGKTR